jgi:hypothetical protein
MGCADSAAKPGPNSASSNQRPATSFRSFRPYPITHVLVNYAPRSAFISSSSKLEARSKVQGSWELGAGSWALAAGSWELAAGSWRLAAEDGG